MANKTTKKTTAAATKASKPTKTVKPTKKAPAKTKAAPKSKAKPKTSVTSTAAVQAHAVDTKKTSTTTPKKKMAIRKSYVILFAVIVAVAAFLYFFRGLFVAAVVNGQPISRLSVIKEAEKQSGKAALENLITNALIEQEARKKHVTVTDKEIDGEIKKIEDQLSGQGQKLDDVLKMQGMTKQDLREAIKVRTLVDKLVGSDVKVTDKEVSDYIDQNKDTIPPSSNEAELKQTVADRLKQQKLSDKVQAWISNLQNNAKPVYFVQY